MTNNMAKMRDDHNFLSSMIVELLMKQNREDPDGLNGLVILETVIAAYATINKHGVDPHAFLLTLMEGCRERLAEMSLHVAKPMGNA